MAPTRTLPRFLRGGPFFFGWWLTGAGLIIGALQGLFLGFGFSAFFLPIQSELETSRAGLALAFSLSQLESGLIGPLNGYLIDRFGPRRVMTFGYIIFGIGFMLMSQVHSIYLFYAAYMLVALGSGMSGFLPVSSTITNWFSRRRAVAVGLAQSGDGVGGTLVPFLAMSIVAFGWRATAFWIGPILMIIGIPLAQLFYRRPEEVGLRTDGDSPRAAASDGKIITDEHRYDPTLEDRSLTPMEALRTRAFWLVAAAHALTLFMVSGVTVHQIPALISTGLTAETAALVLSVSTVCTVVGRLLFGFLGDRFNRQYALALCFLIQAVAVLVLAFAQSLTMAIVFAVLYGFGFGGRGPLLISIRGDFFGRRSFATIMGMSQTVLMVGTIAGPVFAGWIYDVSGSYSIAFFLMAAINIFAMGVLLAARKPVLKPLPLPV